MGLQDYTFKELLDEINRRYNETNRFKETKPNDAIVKVLSMSIDEYCKLYGILLSKNMITRFKDFCKHADVSCMAELLQFTMRDMLKFRGIGKTTLSLLQDTLVPPLHYGMTISEINRVAGKAMFPTGNANEHS